MALLIARVYKQDISIWSGVATTEMWDFGQDLLGQLTGLSKMLLGRHLNLTFDLRLRH